MVPIAVRDAPGIESSIAACARDSRDGLVVMTSPVTTVHRELIVLLADRYRLPAVYPYRFFAKIGGLVSYGIDNIELFRQAASYIDRVLRGQRVGDLPVQAPTKFELVINLKTAKSLGLRVPQKLAVLATEAIQ
jgi:putative ABC transport system substrate-binding protein